MFFGYFIRWVFAGFSGFGALKLSEILRLFHKISKLAELSHVVSFPRLWSENSPRSNSMKRLTLSILGKIRAKPKAPQSWLNRDYRCTKKCISFVLFSMFWLFDLIRSERDSQLLFTLWFWRTSTKNVLDGSHGWISFFLWWTPRLLCSNKKSDQLHHHA